MGKTTKQLLVALAIVSFVIFVVVAGFEIQYSSTVDDYALFDGIRGRYNSSKLKNPCPSDYVLYRDGTCTKIITGPKNTCPTGYAVNGNQCVRPEHTEHVPFPMHPITRTCPNGTIEGNMCVDRVGQEVPPDYHNKFATFDAVQAWLRDNRHYKKRNIYNVSEVSAWLKYPLCDAGSKEVMTPATVHCFNRSPLTETCPTNYSNIDGTCYDTRFECPPGYNKSGDTSTQGTCVRPSHSIPYTQCPSNMELKDDKCVQQLIYRG